MRTTFSCLLCVLLVAACWAQATSPKDNKTERLLEQAINLLRPLINKEKDSGMLLPSPTNDIKECCSQSALQCFKKGLNTANHKNQLKLKLARNLSKLTIMNSMNNCTEEEIKKVECMSCDSYPMVSSKEFLNNLQSHLQKVYTRLP